MYPLQWAYEHKLSRADRRDVPGSPAVETLSLHCGGGEEMGRGAPRLDPWHVRKLACHMAYPRAYRKGTEAWEVTPLTALFLEVAALGLEPQVIHIPNTHPFNHPSALPALLYCLSIIFPLGP